MSKAIQFNAKLGVTRAGPRSRVWIEGKRLERHGWHTGMLFQRKWSDVGLTLTLVDGETFDALPRDERGKVSGKPGRPVIDITGERVASTFAGDHVLITLSLNGSIKVL
jgi:hypothetical protein